MFEGAAFLKLALEESDSWQYLTDNNLYGDADMHMNWWEI